jgi:hypothetical protein
MTPQIRLMRKLFNDMHADLRRPHPFAGERIGFVFGRLANATSPWPLILLTRYVPLADDRYVPDETISARFDAESVRFAMQEVVTHDEGCFVVHVHDWPGQPRFSVPDQRELPPVAKCFRNVGRQHPHGLLLLSPNSAAAKVWMPGANEPVSPQITIVGFPMSIIEEGS